MGRRRGSALIIVLWALLLLGMAVFGVVDIVELSVEHTTHSQHALQARGLALSGLALGLNSQLLRDDPLLHQAPTATQNFNVTIQSEGARLNLNYILRTNHREILVNLFTQWGMKIDQAQSVADCMYDWVTPGDLKSLNGAKANDYVQANLPQRPTYQPFVDLDEVKLVMNAGALDKVKSNWQDSFTPLEQRPAQRQRSAAGTDRRRVQPRPETRRFLHRRAQRARQDRRHQRRRARDERGGFLQRIGHRHDHDDGPRQPDLASRRKSPDRKCWPSRGHSGHTFRCNALEQYAY